MEPGTYKKSVYGNTTLHQIGKQIQARGPGEFHDPQIEPILIEFFQNNKYDLIHLHTLGQFSVSPLKHALYQGVPLVFTTHDQWAFCEQWFMVSNPELQSCSGPETPEKCAACLMNESDPSEYPAGLVEYEKNRLEINHKLFSQITEIWSPSEFIANLYKKQNFHIDHIHALGLPKQEKLPKKSPLFLNKTQCITAAYIGQIQPTKGAYVLIDALNQIPEGLLQFEFWGEANDPITNQKLKSLIDSRLDVSYCGAYTPEKLPSIMSKVDLIVNPSLAESYSLTVREAMMHGVPVIASHVGALPEIVNQELGGELFEVNNSTELALKLSKIAQNPQILSEMKAKLPKIDTIEEDASWCVKRYSALVESIKSDIGHKEPD